MLFLNFVKLKLKNKVSAKQLVREDNKPIDNNSKIAQT
jgi:hypothetical protein